MQEEQNTSSSENALYAYIKIDAMALGAMCCTQIYGKRPSLAREEVAGMARTGTSQVDKGLIMSYPHCLEVFIKHFTEAYLKQQNRYWSDRSLYKREKAALEQMGPEHWCQQKREQFSKSVGDLSEVPLVPGLTRVD